MKVPCYPRMATRATPGQMLRVRCERRHAGAQFSCIQKASPCSPIDALCRVRHHRRCTCDIVVARKLLYAARFVARSGMRLPAKSYTGTLR